MLHVVNVTLPQSRKVAVLLCCSVLQSCVSVHAHTQHRHTQRMLDHVSGGSEAASGGSRDEQQAEAAEAGTSEKVRSIALITSASSFEHICGENT